MTFLDKQDYQHLSDFRYRLRIFQRHSEDICKAQGITALQYQLLLHLKGFPGREWATISELAEKLQAKHHGTVMLIDRCCEQKLVERRQSQADKRHTEIHLLPKGDEMVARIAWLHRPELDHLQQEFPLTTRRTPYDNS